MDKYKLVGFREEGGQSSFRNRLHKSFPRFLAYCGVTQACRSVPQFRRREPYAIGLSVPGDADFDIYNAAASYAAHGRAIVHGGDDDTEIVTRKGSRWTKTREMELLATSAKRHRVLVVVDKGTGFPDSFRLAADGIVAVGPILPRHVIAGAKLCLGADVTPEQAAFIATVPLTIISAALRPGRSISHAVTLMKKAIQPKQKEVSGPTLDDLHGLGEAGAWGRELATDLADWRAGRIGWEDVDRGVLLSGPPGTGKTTFAGALARSCGVRLVLGSLARWQAKGHLGDLLKAMRGAFDEARENAPSIIFLDEIDAIGDREKFTGDSAQYCTEVVSGLLECIDGAESREGIVIVGACNHPHRLDAALVRAGRLDKHVRISFPDQEGREGILRWHLQGLLPDADLSAVAAATEGWSGASLEQLVRQARRRARRGRREMVLDDLSAELPRPVAIPAEMRRRAAVHETGHVIVALALACGELVSVSVESAIVPDPQRLQNGGGACFRDKSIKERTHGELLDSIAVRLGGIAAEEVVLGQRSAGGGGGRGSDLHTATLLALAFEASYGLGEGLAYLAGDDEEELLAALKLDRFLHERVDRILLDQLRRVTEIIERQRLDVEGVAAALLAKGSLSAGEVREIVAGQSGLQLVEQG